MTLSSSKHQKNASENRLYTPGFNTTRCSDDLNRPLLHACNRSPMFTTSVSSFGAMSIHCPDFVLTWSPPDHHLVYTSSGRSSKYYVVIQCGSRSSSSKITPGKRKRAWWNEKFIFQLGSSELKTLDRVNLKIMERDKFVDDCPVGEASIYLRNIFREGDGKGRIEVKPKPYNIVLKDGKYLGELKVGINFIPNVEIDAKNSQDERKIAREGFDLAETKRRSVYSILLGFTLQRLRIRWPSFLFFQTCANHRIGSKKNS